MKIIFLDIDGVLNNKLWLRRLSEDGLDSRLFDPQNVEALNHIIEMTTADIVISSAWRNLFKLNWLKKHLKRQGIKGTYVRGVTPKDSSGEIWVRGREIDQWVKTHTDGAIIFVILDDNNDMEPYMDRLVQTNPRVGLTMEDAAKAIKILQGVM